MTIVFKQPNGFTHGYVECGLVNYKTGELNYKIRPNLDRWSDVYKVIDK